MVCYFNDCNQSFLSPKLLVKHMMVCLYDSNKDWKTLGWKIISCAECNDMFKLHQYGTHYSTMHGLVGLKIIFLFLFIQCKLLSKIFFVT